MTLEEIIPLPTAAGGGAAIQRPAEIPPVSSSEYPAALCAEIEGEGCLSRYLFSKVGLVNQVGLLRQTGVQPQNLGIYLKSANKILGLHHVAG